MPVETLENVLNAMDAAGRASTLAGAGYAARKIYKKYRSWKDRRNGANTDPQTLHSKRKARKVANGVVGVQSLEPHAELVQSPLKYRIKASYPQDMVQNFFRNYTSARNFHSQFGFQCVGEQQVRGIFGMIFRHNAGDAELAGFNGTSGSRLLLARPTYYPVTIGDISQVAYQTGLPYNYLHWSDRNAHQGKVFVAGTSMGDFEDMVAQITPPWMQAFNSSHSAAQNQPNANGDFYVGQQAGLDGPVHDDTYHATNASTNRAFGKWVNAYKAEREKLDQTEWNTTDVQRPAQRFVCFRDGGVNLHFENKHPMGAFVECVVYTIKKQKLANVVIQANSDSNSPDNWLSQIFSDCGKNYLNKTAGQAYFQGAETLLGRLPTAADVTTNPYYPLLPKGSESDTFSERERIKFALASGNKRSVNMKFGGLHYDPAAQMDHNVTLQNVNESLHLPCHEHAILVVVAVNGQLVSVQASTTAQATHTPNESLISGNAACGTNMIVKADYYEQFYPLKVVLPQRYDAMGTQDYEIPASNSQISYTPYTIVDAANVIRGVSQEDVPAGHNVEPDANIKQEF